MRVAPCFTAARLSEWILLPDCAPLARSVYRLGFRYPELVRNAYLMPDLMAADTPETPNRHTVVTDLPQALVRH
ncbi:hypothetical protein ABH944_001383 [Caballeronia udeis]|uniref:Uncharacterized protein n=1 Tax=Caballeronia udeis TaxID=1232866 RepID=A0ABW8MBX6_9BURK